MAEPAPQRSGRPRRALLAAVAVLLAAAAALALALAGEDGGSERGAAAGAGAGATGTVERRTLAERLTASGTIGYAGEATVLARLSGTVTALPAVGDTVRRGERLYGVAGEPVLLLYGSVPAYRDLAAGVSAGADVEQLERNLAALGYEPGSVDEAFSASTAAALAAWQEDLGLAASGELELGRVAFLRGPQRVTGLEATLGQALGGGEGGGGTMVAWRPEAEAELGQAVDAEAAHAGGEGTREPEAGAGNGKKAGPGREPDLNNAEAGEGSEADGRTAAGEGREPEPGERVEAGAGSEPEAEPASVPVLRTSSTRRVVRVMLAADQQAVAARGQRVEVVLPGGGEVPGRVRGLAAFAGAAGESAPGAEAEPGVEATISVSGRRRIPALDGATVSVLFTQRVRRAVLSVPLTALVAIGGGRFAVRVREPGERRQLVVTPGLAADGFVAVAGRGLRVGMTVETGG